MISDKAVLQLKKLSQERPSFLRVRIKSGGCSGLRCEFSLETEKQEADLVIEKEGVFVITDPLSMAFIEGAEIDFHEELMASHFLLRHPEAKDACGCGESFAL